MQAALCRARKCKFTPPPSPPLSNPETLSIVQSFYDEGLQSASSTSATLGRRARQPFGTPSFQPGSFPAPAFHSPHRAAFPPSPVRGPSPSDPVTHGKPPYDPHPLGEAGPLGDPASPANPSADRDPSRDPSGDPSPGHVTIGIPPLSPPRPSPAHPLAPLPPPRREEWARPSGRGHGVGLARATAPNGVGHPGPPADPNPGRFRANEMSFLSRLAEDVDPWL